MRVQFSRIASRLTIHLEFEDDDRTEFGRARVGERSATYDLPSAFNFSDCHPDLLGLAALIVASPWVAKSLELPFPVSKDFAESVYIKKRIRIYPQSGEIEKRITNRNCGLAFSGGVDSVAAFELMPSNTIGIFQKRAKRPDGKRSLYRDAAALHAIEQMNKQGANLLIVESDAEFVRDPVGFSVDMSSGVPLILLADTLSLGSISFGTIAEAAWRTNSEKWADYRQRPVFTRWKYILASVGIDLFMPVANLGELATMRVTRGSKFSTVAQSCVRGDVGRPCGKCVKCFRKRIIEASISGDWPSSATLDTFFSSKEVREYLKKAPIPLEVILMDAFRAYTGNNPWMIATKERLFYPEIDTSFAHRYYGSGMKDIVPERFFGETLRNVQKYVDPMTPEDEKNFESFDLSQKLHSIRANGELELYREAIDSFPQRPLPVNGTKNIVRKVIDRLNPDTN